MDRVLNITQLGIIIGNITQVGVFSIHQLERFLGKIKEVDY